MEITGVKHQRNGVAGAPFCIVTFTDFLGGKLRHMAAFVFEAKYHIAVVDVDQLAQGAIGDAGDPHANSWRGDRFEQQLRDEIDVALFNELLNAETVPDPPEPKFNVTCPQCGRVMSPDDSYCWCQENILTDHGLQEHHVQDPRP